MPFIRKENIMSLYNLIKFHFEDRPNGKRDGEELHVLLQL
jgi:hypothetical protein